MELQQCGGLYLGMNRRSLNPFRTETVRRACISGPIAIAVERTGSMTMRGKKAIRAGSPKGEAALYVGVESPSEIVSTVWAT